MKEEDGPAFESGIARGMDLLGRSRQREKCAGVVCGRGRGQGKVVS